MTPGTELQRWQLILGLRPEDLPNDQPAEYAGMDKALSALYDAEKRGGLGASSPNVNRWLGDIRKYFPSTVVSVLQKDALERLNLTQMLLQPEILNQVEPDMSLVSTLISLNRVMPPQVKESARVVVGKLVRELMEKLQNPLRQAVSGSLARSVRSRRPRLREIDWPRTIQANLKHYQPQYRSVIPERLIGYGRKGQALKHVILCVDQSGSMASSVVHSSIAGAVLASMPALRTRMVVFDTAVVDLSENLNDPVDLLFGVQLGGGTDIGLALGYCQQQVEVPSETILLLVTDLYEGGPPKVMFQRAQELKAAGVHLIVLLALSDEGRPSYDHENAALLAAMDVPVFACTPDLFPDLMAAAIEKRDLSAWAARGK